MARHKGGRGVGDLWGQREAHLHVEVVGPELQLLRPLPANGRSRGEKCVVSIVFGVGSHHLDALGLAELCGELSHERLAQSRRAIKTEAESLGVLDHAREEVVGEVADTCSSLVIAADEDNEPLVGKGVQQKGGLEFPSASGHQIRAGVAEPRRNPFGQVQKHCDVAEGWIKLPVLKIRRSIALGLSHVPTADLPRDQGVPIYDSR